MDLDLNRIFPLLPEEKQTEIKKIMIGYFGTLISDLGYSVVEKIPSTQTISAPQPAPRRQYTTFPIMLHGLSIPSRARLLELYENGEGAWNGKLNASKLARLKGVKGMSYEEIFPNPPPQQTRETLLKRIDETGKVFFPVN